MQIFCCQMLVSLPLLMLFVLLKYSDHFWLNPKLALAQLQLFDPDSLKTFLISDTDGSVIGSTTTFFLQRDFTNIYNSKSNNGYCRKKQWCLSKS
ncbi:hypothetical protein BpHYR1_032714 [Brachionus plicatilis]|uniref:Uncharacterized protein n=1 Tax=Brachionus plicatilis TaxID=10195 RepID=A0A3M7QDJ6_BRAPC|nr:hypothetical protein BpHYR1_032714 [Brachionus plicatilis]